MGTVYYRKIKNDKVVWWCVTWSWAAVMLLSAIIHTPTSTHHLQELIMFSLVSNNIFTSSDWLTLFSEQLHTPVVSHTDAQMKITQYDIIAKYLFLPFIICVSHSVSLPHPRCVNRVFFLCVCSWLSLAWIRTWRIDRQWFLIDTHNRAVAR